MTLNLPEQPVYSEYLLQEEWGEIEFRVYADGKQVLNLWEMDDLTGAEGKNISDEEYCKDWGYQSFLDEVRAKYQRWA